MTTWNVLVFISAPLLIVGGVVLLAALDKKKRDKQQGK